MQKGVEESKITCYVSIFIIEGDKSCSCSLKYLIIFKSLVNLLYEENDIAYLKHVMPFVNFKITTWNHKVLSQNKNSNQKLELKLKVRSPNFCLGKYDEL